ncbi:Protein of unknown function [Mucilaginibacter pineti]|uniref:DUF4199 domain-containing protein n=1 Tax=Mucilaginibacter pineti TaxID=1391627 RepID=A0A1G6YUP9_9SPHI|nr:DUF4199 domain-containing protein [Mucilaginibacter pineti]SDD94041.1 Protein of unknown function [Mucilaginibacter pineti]
MTEEANKIVKKQGIISGVLLGLAITVLNVFAFYYITQMVTSPVLIVIGYIVMFPIVLPIGFTIYFILSLRSKIGGYWSFKEAVRAIFIIFITAYVTQFALNNILFARIIEPNVAAKTEAAFIRSAKMDFESKHESQKNIDAKIKDIHQNLDPQKQATVGQQVMGLGFNIIFMFVLSLIFAGFFKRELQYYNPNTSNGI